MDQQFHPEQEFAQVPEPVAPTLANLIAVMQDMGNVQHNDNHLLQQLLLSINVGAPAPGAPVPTPAPAPAPIPPPVPGPIDNLPTANPRLAKIKEPSTFSGKVSDINSFISEMLHVFRVVPWEWFSEAMVSRFLRGGSGVPP
ncbi:hypothetical protein BOTBODRAFT_48925 [Botryobasidium botryosum FD-172 SS1]|uniref:Uncharacterized protein n=1 Tax=Botryobasidium botryosum (strain FD-172 SS1) TaxID=930990 RepID=A0A067LXY5_BOTB1|nr:hypothetical protein BOTBODRAFT_48925 [Botryobasidium botryosum FD-172 SS1]